MYIVLIIYMSTLYVLYTVYVTYRYMNLCIWASFQFRIILTSTASTTFIGMKRKLQIKCIRLYFRCNAFWIPVRVDFTMLQDDGFRVAAVTYYIPLNSNIVCARGARKCLPLNATCVLYILHTEEFCHSSKIDSMFT